MRRCGQSAAGRAQPGGQRRAEPSGGQVPSLADVYAARDRLVGVARVTPVINEGLVDEHLGGPVNWKLETLQRTGAFKFRGMYNKVCCLPRADRAVGVVVASAGNAGAGTALAAALFDVPCTVVVAEGARPEKLRLIRFYGAEVVVAGPSARHALDAASSLASERGLALVSSFDQPEVIAGQGTVGLEILDQVGVPDTVVVPTSGGGLLAGLCVAMKTEHPEIKMIGVQPTGAAAMVRSLQAGHPVGIGQASTIADGLTAPKPGELTFPIIQAMADDVVTVDDQAIRHAMDALWSHLRVVAEPSAAVTFAALLRHRYAEHGVTVAVLTGGNRDLGLLSGANPTRTDSFHRRRWRSTS